MRVVIDPATHPRFVADLVRSDVYVRAFAAWLEARGWSCRVPALRIAPERKDARAYSDHGDLFATPPPGSRFQDRELRIEVKRTSAIFRGRHDWPFSQFYLIRVDRFDATRPDVIVRVGDDQAACGFVTAATKRDWWMVDVRDSRYPNEPKQTCWTCSPNLVQWRSLLVGEPHVAF